MHGMYHRMAPACGDQQGRAVAAGHGSAGGEQRFGKIAAYACGHLVAPYDHRSAAVNFQFPEKSEHILGPLLSRRGATVCLLAAIGWTQRIGMADE